MKYCRFCGKTIDDDSSFCTHCGKAQTSQASETAFEAIGGSGSRFIKAATGYVQRMYMKIKIQKFNSNSKVWSAIKKWTKRIVVLTLVLIAIGIFVLLGFWLYGFYQTSKWDKEDERREAIALKDISKADKIARELFDEYANDIHQYEFDYSRCNFDHVERGIAIVQGSFNAVIKTTNMLQKNSATMIALQRAGVLSLAQAEKVSAAAANASTIAYKGLGKAMKAIPFIAIAAAVLAIGKAIVDYAVGANKATKEAEKLNKELTGTKKIINDLSTAYNSNYASSLGKTLSLYKQLQTSYSKLSNQHHMMILNKVLHNYLLM